MSKLNTKVRYVAAAAAAIAHRPPPNNCIPATEFMGRTFPDEERLLGSLITAASTGMISARRGLGKSLLGLHIGYVVAARKQLEPWGCGRGDKVVYVDGEMKASDLHLRLTQILNRDPFPSSRARFLQNFHLISRSAQMHDIGYIDTDEGQEAIEAMLPAGTSLVIFDNLSAWKMSGGEDGNAFAPIKRWLIHLRAKGIAVLMIHHTGKNGSTQRGTSIHEDLLDYSILLRDDKAGKPKNGTSFLLEHTKLRGLHPDLPGVCRFTFATDIVTNVMDHKCVDVEADPPTNQSESEIVNLLKQGLKGTEVAKRLGLKPYAVSRMKTSLPDDLQAEIDAARQERAASERNTGGRA